jgi:phosphatidylglycerol---prolipoprotein diacylglyceryl transferase
MNGLTVYPFVLHLGPLELTGYGLMMMVAFLMAGWAIQLDLRHRGLDEDYAADIVIAGVIGGLVGAKLWYVLLTGEADALFRRGGFVWYGGFIGAVIAILLNGWRRRVPARFTAEICAAPLALGYALGRVGCFLVNDDYGIPSHLPWAMKFPAGLPPTTVANLEGMGVHFPPGTDPMQVVAVHPTQLYETAIMFLVFLWLWRQRKHGHGVGWLWAAYMVFAGAERLLVEFVRAKDDRFIGPFTIAQITSVLLILVGGFLMYLWRTPAGEGGGATQVPESLRPKEVALRR